MLTHTRIGRSGAFTLPAHDVKMGMIP